MISLKYDDDLELMRAKKKKLLKAFIKEKVVTDIK